MRSSVTVPWVSSAPGCDRRFPNAAWMIAGRDGYILFSDAVLRQMAVHVPKTRASMLAISGVGPVKLERYGHAFLELLGSE